MLQGNVRPAFLQECAGGDRSPSATARMLRRILSGGYNALTLSGSATSLYMRNFWGHDENLMYFRNHVYPLMSAGVGAT